MAQPASGTPTSSTSTSSISTSSNGDSSTRTPSDDRSSWTWPILIALIFVNVLGSLYWIRTNIVMVGHDATSYLETSIKYTRFFTGISLPHWFQAITFPDYRTPAIYIATQPFLHLFGIDMDGAQMLNIALLPLVILTTYFLGKRIARNAVGLVAAALVGFLPLMAAMSRLYYVEILLTVVVVFNLLALLRTNRFTNRTWSLIWGISLGIGMLVKWTLPMYLLFPTFLVAWQSDLPHEQMAWFRRPRLNFKALAAAALIGLTIALIWFWPNRAAALEFPMGNGLLVAWAILATLSAYAVIIPSSKLSNWWGAILLAATIASLWYFPYIDFPVKLLEIDKERAPEGTGALNLLNYTRYFSFFYREHLGALIFWLMIPAGIFPWLRAWWRRTTLNRDATLLWLSILSAYFVLSIILQHNARNLVPLLPQLTILLAIGLSAYSRTTGRLIGGVWMLLLMVQWSLFTFQPLSKAFAASKPLWADSVYVVSPSSDSTDPAYWIAPDVLATIGDLPNDPTGDPDSLGILVETWEVHRGIFRYLATRADQNLTIMALTEPDSRGWSDLLANRWLLLNDGDNSLVAEPGQAALTRIAGGDALFHQLYQPVKRYPLPNGDTITLYQRTAGPSQPLDFPVVLIETAAIADAINAQSSPASTLYFSSPDIAAWVGIHDLDAEQVVIAEESQELASLLEEADGTLLVATRYDTSDVLDALHLSSYPAGETGDGDFHLTVVGRPNRETVSLPVNTSWDEIEVTGLTGYGDAMPGEVLPIDMTVEGRTDGSLKMSVRLVDPNGQSVGQRDVTLTPDVRLGLLIPPNSPEGRYTIAAVVYDASTVEPLLDQSGNQVGNLSEVVIADSRPRQE